ncbi:MAG TPA: hypothetical protein EYN41_05285 [Flavobacteriales bacterium]|nr:hypothetical protein [Flavobacteriales bacterium]
MAEPAYRQAGSLSGCTKTLKLSKHQFRIFYDGKPGRGALLPAESAEGGEGGSRVTARCDSRLYQ